MLRKFLQRLLPAGLRGWPPEDAELVALDVETTGLDPSSADVLSIGAVPIKGRRALLSDRFEAVIRRESPTHAGSVRIHRLRAMDLEHGLPPTDALAHFRDWLGERPIVGYCVDFDRTALNRELRRGGLKPLDVVAYDIRRLYLLRKQRHRHGEGDDVLPDFDTILQEAGIPPLARHTAIGDAVATALAYVALRNSSD